MVLYLAIPSLLLVSVQVTGAEDQPPSFNYKSGDIADLQRAKSAFVAEYEKVVAYLNKDNPNAWGYTDILNLWDFRESSRKQSQQVQTDPDDMYALAQRVKNNLGKQVTDLGKDIYENETEYQIRFLLLVSKTFSDSKVWNPVASHDKNMASRELRDVVNALSRSGRSVELAEQEFSKRRSVYKSIEEQEREKAIRAALRLVEFKKERSKRLIQARKEMYAKGLLPEKNLPEGQPFMDLACCKYWVQGSGKNKYITGYYLSKSGKRVDYTSGAIGNFNPYIPHAGLFALASGNGYHIYQAGEANPSTGTTYVVVLLGEKVEELYRLRVFKWLNEQPPADFSYFKINYQLTPNGPLKSLILR